MQEHSRQMVVQETEEQSTLRVQETIQSQTDLLQETLLPMKAVDSGTDQE
jgi:hypothetical protein